MGTSQQTSLADMEMETSNPTTLADKKFRTSTLATPSKENVERSEQVISRLVSFIYLLHVTYAKPPEIVNIICCTS